MPDLNISDSGRLRYGQVTIIGVGLLGGSLGMALRRHDLAEHIVGFGRNSGRLAQARSLGAIDAATTDLSEAVAQADLVVLCTPVQHIVETLPAIARAARPGTLLTDVGSTKGLISHAARKVSDQGVIFVGSHPMAGSDRSGVEHSTSDLYEDAMTFVTLEEETPKDRVAEVAQLWRAVGSRVVLIHPDRHDRIVAAISHLPHLLAVAAVRTLAEVHDDQNFLRWIIGNGFRDTTRVAQGSVDMWRDICASNPAAIVESIDAFLEQMRGIRDKLASGDQRAITEILDEARGLRSELNPEA